MGKENNILNNTVDAQVNSNQGRNEYLIHKYRETLDEKYRDLIVLENKGLAGFVASKMSVRNSMIDNDDLFQSGIVGLLVAIDNYDESKNGEFSSFAYTCVLNEIRRTLKRARRKCDENRLSLDYEYMDDEDNPIGMIDRLPDRNSKEDFEKIENQDEVIDMKLKLLRKLKHFRPDIQEYMCVYFGLCGNESKNLHQIAKDNGYSRNQLSVWKLELETTLTPKKELSEDKQRRKRNIEKRDFGYIEPVEKEIKYLTDLKYTMLSECEIEL